MTENVTLLSNCGRESVEQIMKNYFMEFKRFSNISSTKNKICRLNLCNALKSRINFKTIEWQLNTVMFCSRHHILCSYRSSKYKEEQLQSQLFPVVGKESNGPSSSLLIQVSYLSLTFHSSLLIIK